MDEAELGSAAANQSAAKRTLGAAKRAGAAVERVKGGDGSGRNDGGNNTSSSRHTGHVLYMLAGGSCQKMAMNLLSGLRFRFSNGSSARYGLEDMYRVLLATCMGDGEPHSIAQFYRRRGGIENSYKCYEQIRPRTTSIKYPVRILWWFLPFVLYNAWILGCFDVPEDGHTR